MHLLCSPSALQYLLTLMSSELYNFVFSPWNTKRNVRMSKQLFPYNESECWPHLQARFLVNNDLNFSLFLRQSYCTVSQGFKYSTQVKLAIFISLFVLFGAWQPWLPSTLIIKRTLDILLNLLFCVPQKIWNKVRVSKGCQNLYFWVNYSINLIVSCVCFSISGEFWYSEILNTLFSMHNVVPAYLDFLMHRHSRCLKLPKGHCW